MTLSEYVLLFAGMGLVTYVPRFLPLALFARREVPAWFSEWLSFIPPAILAALLAPELLLHRTADGAALSLSHPGLWAAAPTFWIAVKTRSLGGTVAAGMLLFWALSKMVDAGMLP